ncbi:MAG: GAF domain-containing protein [Planctomycetota bacterium]|nr:GAF domain-containing protein [Planctomycetota bacterium]
MNEGRVGALGAHPHPYWIVVLPMAASRGTIAGILAALVGTSLEVIGLAQIGQLNLSTLFDLGPFGQGVLFFGAAFFIGEIHDSHAKRHQDLGKDLDEERERSERLQHERDVLEAATHHLRRTVQERPSLRRSLLDGAVGIETHSREAIAATILDLAHEQCHASMASIWVVDGEQRIDLMQTHGWSGDQESRRIATVRASEHVREVIRNAVPHNSLLQTKAPDRDEPLLIAPLSDGRGVLWGLLCLDDLDPVYLTTETAEVFFGLAEWMTAALMRLDREERDSALHADLLEPESLAERLWLEYDRAARYGGPLRLIGIHVVPDEAGTRAATEKADAALLEALAGFPFGERPYRFGYPGCYVLAAPMIHDDDLDALQRKVVAGAAEDDVALETFVATLDGEASDLEALLDQCAQRFRASAHLPLAAVAPVRIPASLQVGGAHDLRARLQVEMALAERNHRPLTALLLHTGSAGRTTERALILDATRATGALRPVDGLFRLPDGRFVLLLPFTDAEGAQVTVTRFLRVLQERNPDASYLPLRVNPATPEQLATDLAGPHAPRDSGEPAA